MPSEPARLPAPTARAALALLVLATGGAGWCVAAESEDEKKKEAAAAAVTVEVGEAAVVVRRDGREVLRYHTAEVPPPDGADPLFRRSGFIHPLRSPAGGVVTGIHPDDHIHHLGLWHAWTHTRHGGRDIDFWNLAKGLGTVRFIEVEESLAPSDTGAPGPGFRALQHHLALPGADPAPEQDAPRVILEEQLTIRVTAAPDANLVDYTTTQTNVTDQPLDLPAYRYGGGIAYRSPASWNLETSDYLTAEGRSRVDGHATRARWCAMWGPTETGTATVVIMTHPSNHDFPNRMRLWPDGPIFFNYCPVQESAWRLEPETPATLRFRIAVLDGRPDRTRIDSLWTDFADTGDAGADSSDAGDRATP